MGNEVPVVPIGNLCPFKLVKRGICPCGHPVVEEFVPDAKIYMIEKWTILPYEMICGGCKKALRVQVGIVVENGERLGKMVLEVLEEIALQQINDGVPV